MQDTNLKDLITKSLDLMKHDDMYLDDLAKNLNISDNVKNLFVHKLLKIQGVTKEDIRYQGELLDVLLRYEYSGDNIESKDAQDIDTHKKSDESVEYTELQLIAQNIKNKLQGDPAMLELFGVLEKCMSKHNKETLEDIAHIISYDNS